MVYPRKENGELDFGCGLEEMDAARGIFHDFDNIKTNHERLVSGKTITLIEDMYEDPQEGVIFVCRCEEEPERRLLVNHFVFLKQPKQDAHNKLMRDFLLTSASVQLTSGLRDLLDEGDGGDLDDDDESSADNPFPNATRTTLFFNKTITKIVCQGSSGGWVVVQCREEPRIFLKVSLEIFLQGPNERVHERMLEEFNRPIWEELFEYDIWRPAAA